MCAGSKPPGQGRIAGSAGIKKESVARSDHGLKNIPGDIAVGEDCRPDRDGRRHGFKVHRDHSGHHRGGHNGTLSVSGRDNIVPTVVPEPSTHALLGFGLALLHLLPRRVRRDA